MSLGLGLDVARAGLAVTSERMSLTSSNIARIGDPDASRKIAQAVTGPGHAVHLGTVRRALDQSLLEKYLSSRSRAEGQSEIVSALDSLSEITGSTDSERSPAALIANLKGALQQYSAAPHSAAFAGAVFNAADTVVNSLNTAAGAVSQLRSKADTQVANAVERLNNLLGRFQDLNNAVVLGSRRGADVTNAMDARDGILKSLSAEIGIDVLQRGDGDMAIFTDSGVTLFDRVPRELSFQTTPALVPGALGAPVYADGVPVIGVQHVQVTSSGRLAGLIAVRDEIAPAFQRQLDEIARGLIATFAEHDQSSVPTLPAAAGLFTHAGGPAIPPSGTHIPGLAASIKIHANVDPSSGGNPLLVRDGGISGNAYIYNVSGGVSFTERVEQLADILNSSQSFDSSTGIGGSKTLEAFAKDSVSWLEGTRKNAKAEADYRAAFNERVQSTLMKDAGVSLDEEMTNMLELERTFQASSRLISVIDNMLKSLMQSVG